VCRDIGTDAVKSRRDWQKLLVGCREILAVLRCAVEGDAKTISELAVVGVLMTGMYCSFLSLWRGRGD
jgi:hypothetical protein